MLRYLNKLSFTSFISIVHVKKEEKRLIAREEMSGIDGDVFLTYTIPSWARPSSAEHHE